MRTDRCNERVYGHGFVFKHGIEHVATGFPGQHQGENKNAYNQWHPAAIGYFQYVGTKESHVDHQEQGDQHAGAQFAPAPNMMENDAGQ